MLNKLEDLPQYTRKDNLIISGVEKDWNEDVIDKVLTIAKKLEIWLGASDISVCYRLPSRNKEREKPIVVKLVNRWKKEVI